LATTCVGIRYSRSGSGGCRRVGELQHALGRPGLEDGLTEQRLGTVH
jgi:hypothetical protein